MQETAGIRVLRPVGTFVSPRTIAGPWPPSTAYNCVNPIPDHGGTFLSEKLNPFGIRRVHQ
jgi:hypothetical protein